MENEKHLVPLGVKFRAKRFIYKTRPKKVYAIILILFLIAGGSFAYVFMSSSASGPISNSANVLGDSVNSLIGGGELSNEDVIKKVGKLTYVPPNEIPEVATIADVNQLNDQAFFKNAQNGDRVIIYRTAKRVILYRPQDNKIIETGPLVEPTPTPQDEDVIEIGATPTPVPASPIPVLTKSPSPTESPTPTPTKAPIEN